MNKKIIFSVLAGVFVVVGGAATYFAVKAYKTHNEDDELDGYRRGEGYILASKKNYTKEDRKSVYDRLSESQHPEDDESSKEEELSGDEKATEEALELNAEKDRERSKPPRLVPFETVEALDDTWDRQTLFYYQYDDTLVTEDGDEVLEDEERKDIVGNTLTKYDFDANDEMVIYVQNFKFSTVYEIEKVRGAYDESRY